MDKIKHFLMTLRIFISSRSVKKFWTIFCISMIISLVILYVGFKRYRTYFRKQSSLKFQKSLMEVFNERPRKKKTISVDYFTIYDEDIVIKNSQYLWEPNAIHYRYLLPKDGHPKENQKE